MDRRPARPPRQTLVRIDNPDDVELEPASSAARNNTLVVHDNPDDVEAHAAGQPGGDGTVRDPRSRETGGCPARRAPAQPGESGQEPAASEVRPPL